MTNSTSSACPTFRVLGALSVYVEGDYVPLPSSKPLNLLGGLLVSPNEITSSEFLARVVWGDETEVDTRAALRTCTTRLRKLLVRHNLGDELISTVSGGFRLEAGPDELDLLLFRQAVADSVHQATPDGQLRALRGALELWKGSTLCNVESDILHRSVVPLLEEERLQALERVVDVLRGSGRDQVALTELQHLTRSYEGHERFALQLAETLYLGGRREDALSECRRIKNYLDSELGLEPTEELRELEVRILRGEVAAERSTCTTADATAAVAEERSPRQGPEEPDEPNARARHAVIPSGFVGRRDDLAVLQAVLTANPDSAAVVVLTGPPGIGKTALATATAGSLRTEYPVSGVIPLRTHRGAPREPMAVVDEVQETLGGPGHGMLLVLDDAGDEEQVGAVLKECGAASVVVTTSVDVLGLVRSHGAFMHRLQPLSSSDGFTVLRSLLGDSRLTGDLTATGELLRCGWGNPLVLRMIASIMQTRPSWSTEQCATWLSKDPVWRLSSCAGSLSLMSVFEQAATRVGDDLTDAANRLASLQPTSTGHRSTFDLDDARRVLADRPSQPLAALVASGWLEEQDPGTFGFDPMLLHCLRAGPRPAHTDSVLEMTNVFAMNPAKSTKEGA